jgi:hypothetical protein
MNQFSAGLKLRSPLLRQGAPTKLNVRSRHFRPCASFGWDFEQSLRWQGLNVKFQEVVVHSIENCEADVAKQKHSQEIEWTITIMLD